MTTNPIMTKTELLQYWFDEVWANGNLDAIEKMFCPDTRANGLFPEFGLSVADYHDLALAMRVLIKDLKISFSHALDQGDWLAVRTVIDAKRTDTDEPVNVTGQVIVRFEGLRVAEIYSHFNFFSFFEQLGQLPPDALPICLTGQRLQWT